MHMLGLESRPDMKLHIVARVGNTKCFDGRPYPRKVDLLTAAPFENGTMMPQTGHVEFGSSRFDGGRGRWL